MLADDLSLKDLTYLLAVAQHRGFARAAETMNVSQPALSKQIKRLESALGIQVFERSNRQFLITPIGQQILTQAQHILDEANHLIAMAQKHQTPLSGEFSLGIIASACAYLLPYFVKPLQKAYPELELFIQEGLTEQLIAELKIGKLDAMIAATTFDDPQLTLIPLYFEPFVYAYKPQQGKTYTPTVTASAINTNSLLLLEDGHCLKDQTLGVCSLLESDMDQSFRATSLETLVQMVNANIGTAVLPLLAVISDPRFKKELGFSRFKHAADGRTMALYFRKATHTHQNMTLLANHIQSSIDWLLTQQTKKER